MGSEIWGLDLRFRSGNTLSFFLSWSLSIPLRLFTLHQDLHLLDGSLRAFSRDRNRVRVRPCYMLTHWCSIVSQPRHRVNFFHHSSRPVLAFIGSPQCVSKGSSEALLLRRKDFSRWRRTIIRLGSKKTRIPILHPFPFPIGACRLSPTQGVSNVNLSYTMLPAAFMHRWSHSPTNLNMEGDTIYGWTLTQNCHRHCSMFSSAVCPLSNGTKVQLWYKHEPWQRHLEVNHKAQDSIGDIRGYINGKFSAPLSFISTVLVTVKSMETRDFLI